MDFASVLLNPLGAVIDWQMGAADLASDAGLQSAVLISLFTDRYATPGELIAAGFDPTGDPRGWWADTPLDGAPPTDFIGSKLWLRRRSKLLPAVIAQIEDDIEQALAWMIEDGVAAAVTVTSQPGAAPGSVIFPITITRVQAGGGTVNHMFDLPWSTTLANATAAGPLF